MELLTTSDVAAMFQVDQRTVSEWARSGVIPAVRLPRTRGWRFRRDEIEKVLLHERAEAAS